jgi:hypothetical protein
MLKFAGNASCCFLIYDPEDGSTVFPETAATCAEIYDVTDNMKL